MLSFSLNDLLNRMCKKNVVLRYFLENMKGKQDHTMRYFNKRQTICKNGAEIKHIKITPSQESHLSLTLYPCFSTIPARQCGLNIGVEFYFIPKYLL